MKSETRTFTYQTRIQIPEENEYTLFKLASLVSRIEKKLFVDFTKGKSAGELKSQYLKQYGITARQFNAIRVQVEGKIASIKELRKEQINDDKRRILALKKTIKKLENEKDDSCSWYILHQKKRRLATLEARLKSKELDESAGIVRLCFGTRKLFCAQFNLKENGYDSHKSWLKEWKEARNSSFFLLGSKDETSGNQTCTASIEPSGNLTLRLRLPDALSENGKYLEISNVHFPYGHAAIVTGLARCKERKVSDTEQGVAISYRFKHDAKGWTVFASLPIEEPKKVTQNGIGAIGVDINANHLAVVETDRFGNPIRRKKFALALYGKSSNQSKALIGDVVVQIVNLAYASKKPIVIEKLDFQKKKCALREQGSSKYSRMLSSFAYGAIFSALRSRAFRFGVQVKEINPAFTSVIGRVKFAKGYGFSIHESAALCIARRSLGASERLPRHMDAIPDGKGGHVTLSLPVRNGDKHVWSSWRQVNRKLPAVLAAHFRVSKRRSSCREHPA